MLRIAARCAMISLKVVTTFFFAVISSLLLYAESACDAFTYMLLRECARWLRHDVTLIILT